MQVTSRNFSFTFAGPRSLEEIIKKDLVQNKTSGEVTDIWYSYHESKVRTYVCCGRLYASFVPCLVSLLTLEAVPVTLLYG